MFGKKQLEDLEDVSDLNNAQKLFQRLRDLDNFIKNCRDGVLRTAAMSARQIIQKRGSVADEPEVAHWLSFFTKDDE